MITSDLKVYCALAVFVLGGFVYLARMSAP
jgi:hypothetical protein